MSRAYVGLGLPRFTKRTLIAHMNRVDPNNKEVRRWIRRMRIAYRRMFKTEAPLTFDALDLANAYIAIKHGNSWSNHSDRRKPCASGVFVIFKNMLSPNVLAVLEKKKYYYDSGVPFNRSLWAEWRELTKESPVIKTLQKARR